MSLRFAYDAEPEWLVDWILSDLAVRQRSHRRKPMEGMWINRQFGPMSGGRRPYLRGSDLSERRFVALSVLLSTGRSMSDSLYEVGRRLGKTTLRELEAIRTSYYDFQHPSKDRLAENWLGNFRNWTDWAIAASKKSVNSVVESYGKRGQQDYADQFVRLVHAIQDKASKDHTGSLYRDEVWYVEAELEYGNRILLTEVELGPNHSLVGSHARNLAHLYHEQAKYREAERWYWRAWATCLSDPIMAPELRTLLLRAIATDLGNCARGKPIATELPYAGPWTVFGLLPVPSVPVRPLSGR
jgi:hypothetical protein